MRASECVRGCTSAHAAKCIRKGWELEKDSLALHQPAGRMEHPGRLGTPGKVRKKDS